MVENRYIPERGDVVWITLNPQRGREQAGRRPALVLSPKVYNQKSQFALMCPITSQVKRYPFEVPIDKLKVKGVILADQIRTLDWKARKALFITRVPETTFSEVQQKLALLIGETQ